MQAEHVDTQITSGVHHGIGLRLAPDRTNRCRGDSRPSGRHLRGDGKMLR